MNMQETKEISPYKKGLRNKIITTSMEAFARNGIRHVKMDDVAKDLGISKRTLYEIFDKKEDLLYEGVKYYLGERRTQMELKAQQCKNVMDIILQAYKLKVEDVGMALDVDEELRLRLQHLSKLGECSLRCIVEGIPTAPAVTG